MRTSYPSWERERLMFPASFKRSPAVPVSFCLSDPARSTRFILLTRILLKPSDAHYKVHTFRSDLVKVAQNNKNQHKLHYTFLISMCPWKQSNWHTLHLDSTTQVNTLCDRELSAFKLVAPVFLFEKPCTSVDTMLDLVKTKNRINLYVPTTNNKVCLSK